ncbi:MAG: cysteine--tRNA ligase [delta proteobacterium ML8_D]|jgi:cysteinyl-tRNA synthetase|nr:MAG: cysteine--tRNA ligase [delta proteobacterium ML8_D]
MRKPVKNILDTIGNTPLIPIRRLDPGKKVTILAKMESFNPGGSIKDRIALSMIERAEARGELTKDRIILEASSGNTGIGLAMVSAVKGYRCLIAMSEAASIERRQIMRAYGAEILLTPARFGTDGAIEAVYKLALENPDRYFCTDQYNNPDNSLAHYHGTAPEIWEQTEGKVNVIVTAMGTTGTLMGITQRFRELNPKVRIVGVEPYFGHGIQGLKNMKESYRPGIFDKRLPDEIVNVHDDEAFELTKRLALEEGLFVGMSSGAAMAAALSLAAKLEQGLMVVIFPDRGDRYLSTDIFSVPQVEQADNTKALRLINTLTRKKEIFEPLNPGKAGIYSCGPTVHEFAHMGLCRRLVVADLLKRILEYQGYEVTHVMNITDLDDKTIHAALSQGISLKELTDLYTQAFMEDVSSLNIRPAACYPRASTHVEAMIKLTERLVEAGYAYVKHGSVYFDISKLPSYGRLSRVNLSDIDIGRTVDLDDYEKDSPVDFTLFKRVTLDELKRGIGFKTKWGQVRPGWHIECAAMSMQYLGEFFDIHTSGCDLIFPHHENEIAIAMALTNHPLARTWVHSELILVDGKKMSRSAGNVVTLRDLMKKGFTGRQVRFFLLRTHYRKPIHFSYEYLEESARALKRFDYFVSEVQAFIMDKVPAGEPNPDTIKALESMKNAFNLAVNDDLNTSKAVGTIFRLIRYVNRLIAARKFSSLDAQSVMDTLQDVDKVLGCLDISIPQPELIKKIQDLVSQREEARNSKNWDIADTIRGQLLDLGVEVMDTESGIRWRWIKKV